MLLHDLISPTIISEGGNVSIDGVPAERINLTKFNRTQVVQSVRNTLIALNQLFKKTYNKELWSQSVLTSGSFLSGSALHFLNSTIPDDEFTKVKPMVGDIDTMVDLTVKDDLFKFLQVIKGKQIGDATFVGFKPNPAGDQFITLWDFKSFPIKIQIDLELVDFKNDEPSDWSKFSHSSSWDDLTAGVKGAFHKFILRAFTTNTLKDRYIQMKTKLKKITSTDIAFSANGMREKYAPVIDPTTNKQATENGIAIYKEVPTSQSTYFNDLPTMFRAIFEREPGSGDEQLLGSFVGCLKLANKYLDTKRKTLLIKGFVYSIYGDIAAGMYKGDPASDMKEKDTALNLMLKTLNVSYDTNEIAALKKSFYSTYKVDESVAPSTREGITHLENMKDVEFISLVKKIKNDLHGKLKDIKMSIKVDGLGARFGKDSTGQNFFESSRSGPVFNKGSFTSYVINKEGSDLSKIEKAKHYDNMFDLITTSNFIESLPVDSKVICEILYNPMATLVDSGLKFVNVTYNKNILGSMMSIVPITVLVASTGQPHPKKDSIIKQLLLQSTDAIKILDNKLTVSNTMDISTIINPLYSMINDNFITTITSRKKIDYPEKLKLKAILANTKKELADYVINHPSIVDKNKLGDELEGIVMSFDKEPPLKITTPSFKDKMKEKTTK